MEREREKEIGGRRVEELRCIVGLRVSDGVRPLRRRVRHSPASAAVWVNKGAVRRFGTIARGERSVRSAAAR